MRRSVAWFLGKVLGAPFLASFARSGDFDRDAPLRERLPLELALDFVFFLGMDVTQP